MQGDYGCPFVPSHEMHLISKQEFEYFFHFFWEVQGSVLGDA